MSNHKTKYYYKNDFESHKHLKETMKKVILITKGSKECVNHIKLNMFCKYVFRSSNKDDSE